MGKLSRFVKIAKDAYDQHAQQSSQRGPTPQDMQVPLPARAAFGGDVSPANGRAAAAGHRAEVSAADRGAIARYDYLLRTAEPDQIENVHREAFARLTPEQREQINSRLQTDLSAEQRPRSASSEDLARSATRAEMARPGSLRTLFARGGRGGGKAGVAAGALGVAGSGMLGLVAGGAITTAIGGSLLAQAMESGVDLDALAQGVDIQGLTEGLGVDAQSLGLEGMADGLGQEASGLGDGLSQVGEQTSTWTEGLRDLGSQFGLDDIFKR